MLPVVAVKALRSAPSMLETSLVAIKRACTARKVPTGESVKLPQNVFVKITQSLGGCYTVLYKSNMYRIDTVDADALGFEPLTLEYTPNADNSINKQDVLDTLATIYDPEIPVNIVDLGLIYNLDIAANNTIRINMTLTAPGCGMGPVLIADMEYRLGKIPNVSQVEVELVFDPPWDRSMMSEEAKLALNMF